MAPLLRGRGESGLQLSKSCEGVPPDDKAGYGDGSKPLHIIIYIYTHDITPFLEDEHRMTP